MENVDLQEHISNVSRERKTIRKESNCNSRNEKNLWHKWKMPLMVSSIDWTQLRLRELEGRSTEASIQKREEKKMRKATGYSGAVR